MSVRSGNSGARGVSQEFSMRSAPMTRSASLDYYLPLCRFRVLGQTLEDAMVQPYRKEQVR